MKSLIRIGWFFVYFLAVEIGILCVTIVLRLLLSSFDVKLAADFRQFISGDPIDTTILIIIPLIAAAMLLRGKN